MRRQLRLNRLEIARTTLLSHSILDSHASSQASNDSNESGFDALIIATRFHPSDITMLLLQFLPIGRPFVIYSMFLQVDLTVT
ncbi:unnamed protein product [Protopolystoma xenopodis]|uniref:Uncharacterized protein n=1 Tax=Protopolystoma xenopodis TaxID=117903 RepID=A0A448X5I7_9PLAT|nr:unnamed protein product [Protopolystoma xenopodis]